MGPSQFGGIFRRLCGACFDNTLGVREVGLQPFVRVEERHGMRVDGLHWFLFPAQKGEFYVECEFFKNMQTTTLIHKAVHRVDDEAA